MSERRSPLLIGIAGGSGSGKTHLAREIQALAGEANVVVLSMDRYFRTEATKRGDEVNFDHPAHLDLDLLEHHLSELRKCRDVTAPAYDFRTRIQIPEADLIQAAGVVVVEGLFVLATPIVNALDISCFLDVDADQRLLGRILRDHKERGAGLTETVDRYQRFVRPSYNVFVAPTRQNADIVVDFTYRRAFFTNFLAELVREYLRDGLNLKDWIIRANGDDFRLGYRAEEPIMPGTVDIRALARAFPEHVVQHYTTLGGESGLFVDSNSRGRQAAKPASD